MKAVDVRLVVQKNATARGKGRRAQPGDCARSLHYELPSGSISSRRLACFKGRAMPIHQLMRKLAILRPLDGSWEPREICVDFT